MPSLGDVLAAAKTTLAAIGESASAALSYIDLWEIAGGKDNPVGRFFRFINSWVSNNPGASRGDAAKEYNTAGYWANQEKYLSMLDPDVPVPRVLARTITRTVDESNPSQNYRYFVSTRITWMGSGFDRTFGTYVYSDHPLTQSGAQSQALDQLITMFKSKSVPEQEGGEGPDWLVTQRISEFVAYNTE